MQNPASGSLILSPRESGAVRVLTTPGKKTRLFLVFFIFEMWK